jgi:hypothetical protein
MKRLFIAATVFTALASQGQAAQRDPMCDLAKNQKNVSAWNEHYKCLNIPARQAMAKAAPKVKRGPNSEFCDLAKSQRNAPSWNEYYHCR